MKKATVRTALVLFGLLAFVPAFVQPAQAAINFSIQFDTNNRPYYVRDHHRYYVSQYQAQQYYRQRDPHWFQNHRRDWNHNPRQFQNDWNRDHHGH